MSEKTVKSGTISYAGAALKESGNLTNHALNLNEKEAVRIKKMLDDDVIKCNTVFRCETQMKDGRTIQTYVNMLHVRQIGFA